MSLQGTGQTIILGIEEGTRGVHIDLPLRGNRINFMHGLENGQQKQEDHGEREKARLMGGMTEETDRKGI